MKKPELLSPAGNYQSFLAAVNAGCDAVYIGGSSFGARAYADNFTDEEIVRAIKYAHVFSVKVYLTVNTLIREDEVHKVIEYITPFYEAGLDACIVQDIGLISVFNLYFPQMECHVSTQGFITGLESIKFFRNLGAKRVVLAREMTLAEISEIKKECQIELEVFIHGSMCYSYSGACLFSSCIGGRSGNRGRCAGTCRLPFRVSGEDKNEKYLLSMKDQCTLDILPGIIESGVESLKIEGRMKAPEYVALTTAIYRKYIDMYLNNPKEFRVDSKDIDKLMHMYTRSEIQNGYFMKRNDKNMISVSSPSYSGNDNDILYDVNERYIKNNKKIPINAYLYAKENENIVLSFSCGNVCVSAEGLPALEATGIPMGRDDFRNRIGKLGDTVFELSDCVTDISDKVFVPVKNINELRRKCAEKLFDKLAGNGRKYVSNVEISNERPKCNNLSVRNLFINILSYSQAKALISLDFNESVRVFPIVCLNLFDDRKLIEALAEKYDIYIDCPIVVRQSDVDRFISDLRKHVDLCNGIEVHNTESLMLVNNLFGHKTIISGPEIYAWNRLAREVVLENAEYLVAPYELSLPQIREIYSTKVIVPFYGKVPVMNTANCVRRTSSACAKENGPDMMYIFDRKNKKNPVYLNCNYCYNTIYNYVPLSYHNELFGKKDTFESLQISFTDESYNDTLTVLKFVNGLICGKKLDVPYSEYTRNYISHGVL